MLITTLKLIAGATLLTALLICFIWWWGQPRQSRRRRTGFFNLGVHVVWAVIVAWYYTKMKSRKRESYSEEISEPMDLWS